MSPDINSLPQAPSSSSTLPILTREVESNSPRMAATHSSPAVPEPAGTPTRSPRGSSMGRLSISERRRSSVGMNLSSSPVFPTADPHHQRAPSLGELHQQFEQEQEAQVNRLLQQIHVLQAQLQQHQQQRRDQTTAIDDSTPSSEHSASFFAPETRVPRTNRPSTSSISNPYRQTSRPPSQTTSPSIRPQDPTRPPETTESIPGYRDSPSRRGSRDESAFYQAEAAMLNRENQMLRQRIRELERQIGGMPTSRPPASSSDSAVPGSSVSVVPRQAGPETADPHAVESADVKD